MLEVKASDCSVHLGSGLDSRGILQFDFVEVASFAPFFNGVTNQLYE